MATYSERRALVLESVSIATSLSSFDEDPETSPNIPDIMIPAVQGASRGDSVVDWIQGELKDWLHERDRMRTVPPRDDGQLKSVEASHAPTDTYPMHERFCFPAENIYLLVNGVLYSVHRYFFERDSSSFAGQGLSKREPMVLADISTGDLDLFLSILYPSSFGLYSASTVEDWSSILHLADKWSFESIRALAITQLAPIASPIDKIVLGRRYDVNEWLPDAYGSVCVQPAALTQDEGRRLGVDDVIRINAFARSSVSPPFVCRRSRDFPRSRSRWNPALGL
ncbi:hypothetical protein FIBSPDRAFT_783642 [Athelia psychrophila]|uniref:BTB domain-containing protein n=1 Tax=Athelia psychrophila TaxID=1759441 RepID=A0A166NMV7_9AGAM|nr:hypothetical protein FIBSPDRAFT_783642 [Fibularhizoctonia sp. CBS 109695]